MSFVTPSRAVSEKGQLSHSDALSLYQEIVSASHSLSTHPSQQMLASCRIIHEKVLVLIQYTSATIARLTEETQAIDAELKQTEAESSALAEQGRIIQQQLAELQGTLSGLKTKISELEKEKINEVARIHRDHQTQAINAITDTLIPFYGLIASFITREYWRALPFGSAVVGIQSAVTLGDRLEQLIEENKRRAAAVEQELEEQQQQSNTREQTAHQLKTKIGENDTKQRALAKKTTLLKTIQLEARKILEKCKTVRDNTRLIRQFSTRGIYVQSLVSRVPIDVRSMHGPIRQVYSIVRAKYIRIHNPPHLHYYYH